MLQSISRRGRFGSDRGFSLIEALVVVAITLVLVAIAAKGFLRTIYTYNLSGSARQIAAIIQLARSKATARNNRYQVVIDTTARTYSLNYCSTQNLASTPQTCTAFSLDSPTAANNLPTGVTFSTSGISSPPIGSGSVTQAADMTFNSRGLLIDNSTAQNVDLRCFYLARSGVKPMAVCTTLSGRTAVYTQNSSGGWSEQ